MRADVAEAVRKLEQTGEVVLSSFDALTAYWLKERPQDFEIDIPEPGVMSLTRDGYVKIFLGASVFQNSAKLNVFLNAANSPQLALIFVGTEAELPAPLESQFSPQRIHQLALPLFPSSINVLLRNLHQFQLIDAGHQEKHTTIHRAAENVKEIMSISRVLNGERDIPRLLNLILLKAREVCNADAGSIYTLEGDIARPGNAFLRFRFTQNRSIEQNLSEFTLPISKNSIVGNCVIHETTINIPDLYKLSKNPGENPFGVSHDSSWDKRIGYESHSMLTVPMFDISHRIIGVIQLINRKKNFEAKLASSDEFAQQVTPFTSEDQEYAEIVGQQAGIALENASMHEEINNLFDGFVNASVKAIEQRDPTTSGHSHRVALFTKRLAIAVGRTDTGLYKAVRFSDDQLRELEYASLLHDFGKLGVREAVLTKGKKLYEWQWELLEERFEAIRASYEIDYLRKVVNYYQAPNLFPSGFTPEVFLSEKDRKLQEIEEVWTIIQQSNEPTVLHQENLEKLKDLARMSYSTTKGASRKFLKSDEFRALSVTKGSLTPDEFAEIQSHVVHTYEFLKTIPWGRKLANVPEIAGKHHEKLDGSGYPTQVEAESIPVQSRMMAISDIYDALTAADRPYKKSLPVEKALDILSAEVKHGKLDADLFQIFIASEAFKLPG